MKPVRLFLTLLFSAAAIPAAHAALPRFPQPQGHRIVFVADGNIWSVADAGGTAVRLTSAQGQDMFPRVSPDGKWIAYTEASNAGTDIWVIPANGGAARRLTFHPTVEAGTGGRHGPDNMVLTWTCDSKYVVYLTKRDQWNGWTQNMYKVPVAGGLPIKMAIDSGVGLATFSPDGKSIAYNRIFRNFRTWKRYYGGLAQDVYTYNFDTRKLDQITHWRGTDTSPMWYGRRIFFLSDRGPHQRANIWVYDLDQKSFRQVTHFTDYDIDFPALGGDAIAFQQGGKLYELSLPDEKLREVPLDLPDDNVRTRPHVVPVADDLRVDDPAGQVDYALAPNGERVLLSARGDIFSVPAQHGATRDLTRTQGADEDHPAWSPNGKWAAYTTDASGEQQIAIRPAEGGAEKQLTQFTAGYYYAPVWSPDNATLAFSDGAHNLWLSSIKGSAPKLVAQDKRQEIHDQSFSPDGRWLAFSMSAPAADRRDLYLYEIANGKLTRIDNGLNIDGNPGWSADGKYLFFVSSRNENMAVPDVDFDFAELKSMGIYAIPLARDTPSPVAPRSDEAVNAGDQAQGDSKNKTDADSGPIAPIKVDLDGMMARVVALPIQPASISQMDVRKGHIFYQSQPVVTLGGPLPGEQPALHVYAMKSRKDQVLAENVDDYSLAQNGKTVLIRQGDGFTIINTDPDDQKGARSIDTSHMRMLVDPRAEWTEMFNNAWRLERDLFFSPAMNGVDWQAVHDSYARLLPLLGSREDLNYLIGQMIGEMSNSHTYVGGGSDGDTSPSVHPGVLGVDWALDAASGRYKLAKIYPGDNSRPQYRSPLAQPGLNVKAGDYVLAINGVELKAPTSPDALLQTTDTATPVDLTIADSPNGTRRNIRIKLIGLALSVREAAWIKHNRELVDKLSGGRIGYVYLSDMENLGLQQFMRQFYAQTDKQALIMDDRWNGGGFIAPYALERLRRVLSALTVNREGSISSEPNDLVSGPKVTLLNHQSASDGDIFPYLFRKYGLGKLIGTRSWGGVRGIRGYWPLMDGGFITIPEEAMYNLRSKWAVENHGVQPDITVENTPAELLAGHDTQLETAVSVLMTELGNTPKSPPSAPALLPAYPASGIVKPQPQP